MEAFGLSKCWDWKPLLTGKDVRRFCYDLALCNPQTVSTCATHKGVQDLASVLCWVMRVHLGLCFWCDDSLLAVAMLCQLPCGISSMSKAHGAAENLAGAYCCTVACWM